MELLQMGFSFLLFKFSDLYCPQTMGNNDFSAILLQQHKFILVFSPHV